MMEDVMMICCMLVLCVVWSVCSVLLWVGMMSLLVFCGILGGSGDVRWVRWL